MLEQKPNVACSKKLGSIESRLDEIWREVNAYDGLANQLYNHLRENGVANAEPMELKEPLRKNVEDQLTAILNKLAEINDSFRKQNEVIGEALGNFKLVL